MSGNTVKKQALKRYTRNFILVMSAYVGILFLSRWLLNYGFIPEPNWLRILVAVAPMLPIFWGVREVLIFTRSFDELEWRKMSEAMIISFLIVGLSCATYGMVEGQPGFPHVGLVWVFPALMAVYGIALCYVVKRRYS
ncbi:MAG TPA: hypothetical protein VIC08_01880 [Cellvibrionaceae bacterium]